MDADSPVSVDLVSSLCPHRAPAAACPPMSRDRGRAAAGRAGSFNSGKNDSEASLVRIVYFQMNRCGRWRAIF